MGQTVEHELRLGPKEWDDEQRDQHEVFLDGCSVGSFYPSPVLPPSTRALCDRHLFTLTAKVDEEEVLERARRALEAQKPAPAASTTENLTAEERANLTKPQPAAMSHSIATTHGDEVVSGAGAPDSEAESEDKDDEPFPSRPFAPEDET